MAGRNRDQQDKQRALTLLQLGDTDEALALYASITDRNPREAESWYRQGVIHWERGDGQAAEQCFRRLIKLRPEMANAHYSLALALVQQERLEEAVDSFRKAVRLQPDFIEAIHNLALQLGVLGRFDEAHQALDKALALQPHHPKLIAVRAEMYDRQGEAEKAYEALQPLLEPDVAPSAAVASTLARFCRKVNAVEEAIDMHQRLVQDMSLPREERMQLHFSLGNLLDTARRYDEAFDHVRRANGMKDADFVPQRLVEQYAALRGTFSREYMAQAPRVETPSSHLIFIIGMPRSGSTLVEQILASHPDVQDAGEAPWLPYVARNSAATLGSPAAYPQCLQGLAPEQADRLAAQYHALAQPHRADRPRVTDKMLLNFQHLGLIALLFPEAKVIHCRRDPLDTCLSSFFIDYRSRTYAFSYDLGHLGLFYREYRRLMDHWRAVLDLPMLELDYEAMVADQEGKTRELLDFCNLPWNDTCLRFHENRRAVTTASYNQVRQPLYRSSVGRWRHYEAQLQPLRDDLKEYL